MVESLLNIFSIATASRLLAAKNPLYVFLVWSQIFIWWTKFSHTERNTLRFSKFCDLIHFSHCHLQKKKKSRLFWPKKATLINDNFQHQRTKTTKSFNSWIWSQTYQQFVGQKKNRTATATLHKTIHHQDCQRQGQKVPTRRKIPMYGQ